MEDDEPYEILVHGRVAQKTDEGVDRAYEIAEHETRRYPNRHVGVRDALGQSTPLDCLRDLRSALAKKRRGMHR